jgi:UDP-N-acetylmuramoyl-tripeptide--D-alanyl-D-alanine ligase
VTFWTSARVAEALGTTTRHDHPPAFSRVSTDTRELKGGELFVALQGERFDAHDFLADGQARGATGAVVRKGTAPVSGLVFFEVEDTLAGLGALARTRRRALPAGAPVIAVTGSSGKTTTKELIRAALSRRWRVHATAGNLNNLIGVPLTILAAPDDAQALVVEAGASIPGEIPALRAIIEPTIAVVTNVGYAHVGGFGSLAAVMEEKTSLCEGVALAVVGTDPPELAVAARRRAQRTLVAGRLATADVKPEAASLDDAGHPSLRWNGAGVTLPVLGLHQVDNAMIALAVAREAGVEPARAVVALAGVRLPPGRGGIVAIGDLTVIDDTYNANPASLRAAVELARWLADRRRRPLVVVVGSMLELGPESDKLHHAAALEIAAAGPDLVGAVGEFVAAFKALGSGGPPRVLTAPDAEALGPPLRAALRGDEVVLLKASRGVALERVLRHLQMAGAK